MLTCKDLNNKRTIIINQFGRDSDKCCVQGRECHCSNLTLALEHIQDNTEIRITSYISLKNTVLFGNVSNISITGDNKATVICDHQGAGLMGKNIGYIIIQGITWDSCHTELHNSSGVCITNCNFEYSIDYALDMHGHLNSSFFIRKSNFSYNGGGIFVSESQILINECDFISNGQHYALLIYNNLEQSNVNSCNFINNSGPALSCESQNSLQTNSSNFINNTCSAIAITYSLVLLSNATFYNNIVNATCLMPSSCYTETESISNYD